MDIFSIQGLYGKQGLLNYQLKEMGMKQKKSIVRIPLKRKEIIYRVNNGLASQDVLDVYNERVKPHPQTNEYLAELIGYKLANEDEKTLFYEKIINLVRKCVGDKFGFVGDDQENYIQECLCRIMQSIHTYNPTMSKLTTWIWYVNKSVIFRKSMKQKKIVDNVPFSIDEGIDESNKNILYNDFLSKNNPDLQKDMQQVIQKLFNKFKNKKHILYEIFGNPFQNNYRVSGKFVVVEISKKLNIKLRDIKKFIKDLRSYFVEIKENYNI